jgi:hypothetical protein
MPPHITRSITQKLHSVASRLGFTNEIREVRQFTDNPLVVIIVEQPHSETNDTRVVVMHLTDSEFFYDKSCPAFPESLTDANITFDDDGINHFLVINGPNYGVYYALSSREIATVA